MGQMRFAVFPPERLTPQMAEHACLTALDQSCARLQARAESGRLVLQRDTSDSAVLHLAWPLGADDWTVLCTGTLIEQPAEYHLPLELARGTIGQLRNQLEAWKALGMVVPGEVLGLVRRALWSLGQAAVSKAEPARSAGLADEAIRLGLQASALLAAAYTDQVLAARRRSANRPMPILGGNLQTAPPPGPLAAQFVRGFNTAAIPLPWSAIEREENRFDFTAADEQIAFARAHGLKVCAGPLVKFDRAALPDWLLLWEGDFGNIQKFASSFVRAAVERYRGRVDIWHCASRFHSGERLGLTEEERLRLVAHLLELTRQLDSCAAAVVSFDQPWGEYMGRCELDFAPLHLADALVRAGLELAALGLEINLAYCPGGTLPRSILELSRLVGVWASLGLPLLVWLVIPGGSGDDPQAQRRVGLWPGEYGPQRQARLLARWVPLLLAKPGVCGVVWNQWRDAAEHEFPHGGLFDAAEKPKPAWEAWTAARAAFDPTAASRAPQGASDQRPSPEPS